MDTQAVKLAPSILAADFAHLGKHVGEAEQAGADRIHIDIMDGHFVPNISMGAPIVESLRLVTRLPLETHLMISDPDFFLDEFTEAGSDSFLVHWEGNNNLHRIVQRIKALGKRVGVVINPRSGETRNTERGTLNRAGSVLTVWSSFQLMFRRTNSKQTSRAPSTSQLTPVYCPTKSIH